MITELHADGTTTARCTACGKAAEEHALRPVSGIGEDGELVVGTELLCESDGESSEHVN